MILEADGFQYGSELRINWNSISKSLNCEYKCFVNILALKSPVKPVV